MGKDRVVFYEFVELLVYIQKYSQHPLDFSGKQVRGAAFLEINEAELEMAASTYNEYAPEVAEHQEREIEEIKNKIVNINNANIRGRLFVACYSFDSFLFKSRFENTSRGIY